MQKEKKSSSIRPLLQWAGKEKYWMYLAVILSFFSGICTMIPYYGIYSLMSAVYTGTCTTEFVIRDAGIIAGGIVIRFLLFGASGVASHKGAYRALLKVRCMVIDHMAKVPLGALNERSTGEIKTVLNEDIEKLELFLAHNVPELICYLIGPVVVFIYLLTVNVPLALVSLVPLVLALFVMCGMFMGASSMMGRANQSVANLNSVMVEYISGMKLIKAYNMINDKRRIVISSFEKWYTNQVKYHKVNGSPPGEELCKRSYSVPDAAEILKVKPETIYTLIRQGKLKTETTDFCMRIPKEEFERWYRSQSRYRTAADRERDREIEAQTISIPEMAKLLGIPRKNVYGILDCKKYRDCFVIERVADRPRITKASFEAWLLSQSTYQVQPQAEDVPEEPPLKLQSPKSGKYYSFQEIQDFYGISRTALVTWIREEGIPTIDVGRAKRVRKDVFDDVLKSKRKVEGDT